MHEQHKHDVDIPTDGRLTSSFQTLKLFNINHNVNFSTTNYDKN